MSYLVDEVIELRKQVEDLEAAACKMKGLLREVMSWHADKNSRDYNDCDQDKCLWCEQAQALIDEGEAKPGVDSCKHENRTMDGGCPACGDPCP